VTETLRLPLPQRRGALRAQSPLAGASDFLRFITRSPLTVAGLVILLVSIVGIAGAPALAAYGPLQQDFAQRLKPPSWAHAFGTDDLGRDVLTRLLYGGRVSVPVGFVLVISAAVIGTSIGGVAGFAGGWIDELLMRVADIFLAFPPIVLALALAAALGPDLRNAIVALVVVWWPYYARMMRGITLAVRQRDYVLAAQALGASHPRVLLRAILPNTYTPILVLATIDMGSGITAAASLSYLGLGVRPPTAEWGSMVAQGAQLLDQWWLAAFPGAAILLVVLGLNVIGDSVRDALDPRLRHQRQ
jgi:peptide/nickel transport system permease protein